MHEAQEHKENSFITLTYDSEHLPSSGTLVKSHFQDFMKRLRWHNQHTKIRFYHAGEYGEKFHRPHYHACIFGWKPHDQKFHKKINGVPLYTSASLQKIWGMGFCSVGAVTDRSAAYVARYIMKKINGDQAHWHYHKVDEETGEMTQVLPEYTTMSRRPGIGKNYYEKYKSEIFPDDFVLNSDRKKGLPPRYYLEQFELEDPKGFEKIKANRVKRAKANASDATRERLVVRETVLKAKTSKLFRVYEDGTIQDSK